MSRAALLAVCLALATAPVRAQEPGHEGHDHGPAPTPKPVVIQKNLTPIGAEKLKLRESFWSERLVTLRRVALEAALDQCEKAGRVQNFALAAAGTPATRAVRPDDDAQVYPLIEALANLLAVARDPALEARAETLIDVVASAQAADGYLHTYHQIAAPDARWKNLKDGHELDAAARLIEAALAYSRATGKTRFLDVATKLADHLDRTFGPGKKLEPPALPGIELALVKLSEATAEKRYLELARFFVDQRGKLDGRASLGDEALDRVPLRQQTEMEGDPARATRFYAGATAVAAATRDEASILTLKRIFEDTLARRLDVTGGLSPLRAGDITAPDRQGDLAAATGMATWAQRMLLATGEAGYADVVEREMYNAILASVGYAGDSFLAETVQGSRGDLRRQPAAEAARAAVEAVRFLAALPSLVFAVSGNTIYVCQYVSCEAILDVAGTKVQIRMDANWPNSGHVSFKIDPEKPATFALRLRRPAWCQTVYYQHDLKEQEHKSDFPGTEAGWELYERPYAPNDGCAAHFFAPVRRVHAGPSIGPDQGRVAICRGPLVYAVEGVDNRGLARSLALPHDAGTTVFDKADLVLGRPRAIKAKGLAVERGIDGGRVAKPTELTLVPYWQWANRGPSEMAVWIPQSPDLAEMPGEGPAIEQNGVRISASHCWRADALSAVNDGRVPSRSNDATLPRLTFWDHRGTTEWVQYEFPADKKLTTSRVFWFEDGAEGRCRVPFDWVLQYRDLNEWKSVTLTPDSKYTSLADGWNEIHFEPVTTNALRLELHQKRDVSAGILEWEAK